MPGAFFYTEAGQIGALGTGEKGQAAALRNWGQQSGGGLDLRVVRRRWQTLVQMNVRVGKAEDAAGGQRRQLRAEAGKLFSHPLRRALPAQQDGVKAPIDPCGPQQAGEGAERVDGGGRVGRAGLQCRPGAVMVKLK